MNLSDTFYVALCMTILIIGVVYWFWTQNQFVLRKLNLLNNIVFEMRAQMNKESVPDAYVPPTSYPPAPSSEMGDDEDLLHEELHAEVSAAAASASASVEAVVEEQPLVVPQPVLSDVSQGTPIDELAESLNNDLQPGGVGSGVKEIINSSVLESMTIKELRRLAEQRGIQASSSVKKPALISMLREAPKQTITPFEATVELS